MGTKTEKYIGQSPIKGTPKSPFSFTIKNKAVTVSKLGDDVIAYIENLLEKQKQEIIAIIDEHNKSFVQHFGDSTSIGISQRILTQTIQRINAHLNDIIGVSHSGVFTLTATPEVFWSKDGADVRIQAEVTDGLFDWLKIYCNDVLIAEVTDTTSYVTHTHITTTSNIKAECSVFGIEYTKSINIEKVQGVIKIGTGKTLEEALSSASSFIYTGMPSISIEKTITEGDYVWVWQGDDVLVDYTPTVTLNDTITTMMKEEQEEGVAYRSYSSLNQGTYSITVN